MARKTGELKKRCWLAKQRLKMGYWQSVNSEKSGEQIHRDILQGGGIYSAVERPGTSGHVTAGALSSPRDERMYKIVCEILESPEVTLNPIGRLIERDVYDVMDSASKQRYILELSEKFRELKERYYKEKAGA